MEACRNQQLLQAFSLMLSVNSKQPDHGWPFDFIPTKANQPRLNAEKRESEKRMHFLISVHSRESVASL